VKDVRSRKRRDNFLKKRRGNIRGTGRTGASQRDERSDQSLHPSGGGVRRMANRYVSIKLPAELIEIIDEKVVGRLGYRSRAEFLKVAARKELEALGLIERK
jgi:hypothetical protein